MKRISALAEHVGVLVFLGFDTEMYIMCHKEDMSHLVWFPNRSGTNQAVQAQKRARSLKFWS